MFAIGFKNFRQFKDFPDMELGGVTFLVGGNNAGKSTIIKALMLCMDNLQACHSFAVNTSTSFIFDGSYAHDVQIRSFRRALNKNADLSECIEFSFRRKFYQYDFHFHIEIGCNGHPEDSKGRINKVRVEECHNGCWFCSDYKAHQISYGLLPSAENSYAYVAKVYEEELRRDKTPGVWSNLVTVKQRMRDMVEDGGQEPDYTTLAEQWKNHKEQGSDSRQCCLRMTDHTAFAKSNWTSTSRNILLDPIVSLACQKTYPVAKDLCIHVNFP